VGILFELCVVNSHGLLYPAGLVVELLPGCGDSRLCMVYATAIKEGGASAELPSRRVAAMGPR
jgi:hypothetical protein